MKKMNRVAAIVVLLVGLAAVPAMVTAQEVSVGADIVSSYVWRGTKFGEGAAVQPTVEFSSGGFAVGAWGSFGLAKDDAAEADLYAGYSFDFGLYLGLTDYYFPVYYDDNGDLTYDDYLDSDNHYDEVNVGYETGPVSLSANMFFGNNMEDDKYFEVAYDFGLASVFVGAGDESYTVDGDFAICNVGISAEKEIEITDKYSLPLFGSFIVNPDSEQAYIVVGMSF
jgi:hypothetical protein